MPVNINVKRNNPWSTADKWTKIENAGIICQDNRIYYFTVVKFWNNNRINNCICIINPVVANRNFQGV